MHLTTVLTGLVSLLSITAAVPMTSDKPTSTSTSVSKSLISPSSSASVLASATSSPNPYEAYACPKGQYKSCCKSVAQTGDALIKPLGQLVPVVSGLHISSALAFECKHMAEQDSPDTCNGKGFSPMCCSNKVEDSAFNACKPFAEAKKKYYASQMKNPPESQVDVIMDALT